MRHHLQQWAARACRRAAKRCPSCKQSRSRVQPQRSRTIRLGVLTRNVRHRRWSLHSRSVSESGDVALSGWLPMPGGLTMCPPIAFCTSTNCDAEAGKLRESNHVQGQLALPQKLPETLGSPCSACPHPGLEPPRDPESPFFCIVMLIDPQCPKLGQHVCEAWHWYIVSQHCVHIGMCTDVTIEMCTSNDKTELLHKYTSPKRGEDQDWSLFL